MNQPRDELRKTVTQIKNDVHIQLEQTKRTNKNFNGIAKELRKLHREGINNATNSVTVVAVLFATVAFAAIFTVPGGDDSHGMAVVVSSVSFKILFIFNAIALFTSLAVVVVQITLPLSAPLWRSWHPPTLWSGASISRPRYWSQLSEES